MKQNSERKTMEVISRFVDLTGKDVLEIGCGDGRLTAWLTGKPKHLTAIEPDGARAETARKNVAGADFFVCSGERLAFSAATFDIVLFSLSLHHQDSRVALQEASRVLRDDGSVLVLEPLNDGGIEQVCKVIHNEDREKREAQDAIANSAWVLHRSETIESQWVFETPEELYQWVFGYYGRPFDLELAQAMAKQPEVDLQSRPIVLQEKMVLQWLKKTP